MNHPTTNHDQGSFYIIPNVGIANFINLLWKWFIVGFTIRSCLYDALINQIMIENRVITYWLAAIHPRVTPNSLLYYYVPIGKPIAIFYDNGKKTCPEWSLHQKGWIISSYCRFGSKKMPATCFFCSRQNWLCLPTKWREDSKDAQKTWEILIQLVCGSIIVWLWIFPIIFLTLCDPWLT